MPLINVETKEKKSIQIFSFSSKLESDLQTGSGQNVPAPQQILLLNTVRHIGTLPYEDWRPGCPGPVGAQSPAFLNCNRRGGRVLLR